MKTFLKEVFTDSYVIAAVCVLTISIGYVIYQSYHDEVLRRKVVLLSVVKDLDDSYKDLNIKLVSNKDHTIIMLTSRKFEVKDCAKISAVYQPVLKKVGVKKIYYFKTVEENGKEIDIPETVHDIQKDQFEVLNI